MNQHTCSFARVSFSLVVAGFLILGLTTTAAAYGELHNHADGRMDPTGTPALVPWPISFRLNDGALSISGNSRIVAANDALLPLAKIFAGEIQLATGRQLQVALGAANDGDIHLLIDPQLKDEACEVRVNDKAEVRGADYNAVAMGTVTLLQSMKNQDGQVTIPHEFVKDQSKLKYCGAMLDVARKPHSIATLKACVEAARMYKIRYFQLHMTDENAWTFPSTAYPELGKQNFAWAGGEKPEVYNIDDLKALVAFADARGVTIVPELELAGHSGQMRAALPDVFQFKDADGKLAGGSVINVAGPGAYKVLDTLIGEAADIFKSSPYIHCGCDEAGFGGTDKYPAMKAFMAEHHLADATAVFNYHVIKLDELVKKHGKQMIVWEGAPIEPVLPPRDIVFMPWVGGSGFAATLVKDGYHIINAPWGVRKAYMDPYEVNGAQISRDTDLLLGATAISWQAVQEMALPFMRYNASLRNEPTRNPDSGRNLEDFIAREAITDPLLDHIVHGFTFKEQGLLSPLKFNRLDPMFTDQATLTLQTNLKSGVLHYTLDGSDPTAQSPVYSHPIVLKDSTHVRAEWIGATGSQFLYPYDRDFRKVTQIADGAIGAKVTYTPAAPGYPGPGPKALTDGILAPGDNYLDPGFVGWSATPVQIDIDLGKIEQIHNVGPRSVRSDGGLELPDQVEIQLSTDGRNFHPAATVTKAQALQNHGWFVADLKPSQPARYIRLLVPAVHDWFFTDEVIVNGKLPGPNFPSESMGKKITFATPPQDPYTWEGPQAATDGYVTPTASFAQLEWLGWQGKNIDATIDMGKPTELHEVGGQFLQHVWSGVFPPAKLHVLVSNDDKNFKQVAEVDTVRDNSGAKIYTISAKLKNVTARYVKIVADTNGEWLFTDELFVNPKNQE